MAVTILLCLLLVASGGTMAVGDDGARLPHLELPGVPDSGCGHGSDAPPPQILVDTMSKNGCGRFAALLAATPNAIDILLKHLEAGGAGDGGGLTVFCPDDEAVGAFEPTFRALPDSDRLAVLLHHGAAGRYVQARLAGFDMVVVPTLAVAGAATDNVLVCNVCDTMRLSPTWRKDGMARVTKTVSSEEGSLVLHVVDAVLLRGEKLLDGAAERGGFLGWLHGSIPRWMGMGWFVSAFVGSVGGAWLANCQIHRMQ
jgi:hypothetical protein